MAKRHPRHESSSASSQGDLPPSTPPPGRLLGVVSQALVLFAWLLGLAALTGLDTLVLAAMIIGFGALVSAGIAFLHLRHRFGPVALAAGWVQLGGLGLALLVFLAIPGEREWGKLGAFIFATGGLAIATSVAHLVASLALRHSRARAWATIGAAGQAGALAMSLLAVAIQAELLIAVLVANLAGHAALLVALVAVHPRSPA